MSPHAPHHASTSVDRPSIVSALSQFPNVCFTLALLTDIAYWQTSYLMWTEFSAWLLLVGISFGALALIVGIITMFARRSDGTTFGWPRLLGPFVVLVLAFFNNLIRRARWLDVGRALGAHSLRVDGTRHSHEPVVGQVARSRLA